MHSKLKYLILALFSLLVLLPGEADAQSKLGKLFGKKQKPVVEEEPEYQVPLYLLLPRQYLQNTDYLSTTGISLDEFSGDIWNEIGYVPEITIPLPKGTKPESYAGKFNLKEYTRMVLEEEKQDDDEEDDIDYSETPEEYNIWSNASINPYNVKLSEMKDTVRIDVSSYTSPGYKYVTSEFGGRWGRLHAGIDLKVFKGDTIRSAFDKGIVRIVKFDRRGYGNYAVIRHENGLETLYGHMSKVLVAEGDTLKAGEAVGLGGSTGRSTGPHLHFELRYLGNPINPRDAIDFDKNKVLDKTLVLCQDNFQYQNIKFSKKSKRGRKGSANYTKGGKSGKGKTKFPAGAKVITDKKGDTLGGIAKRHGTTVAKLQKLNGIRGTMIRAGQKLRVR